jgi:hypothetical protein
MAKSRILVLAIAAVLVFSFITGCSTSVSANLDTTQPDEKSTMQGASENAENAQSANTSLKDLLPDLGSLTNVSVYTPGGMALSGTGAEEGLPGGIYARADESQARIIVEFLIAQEDTEFVEVEAYNDDGALSMSSAILIANEHGSCVFSITASVDDNSIFYIVLLPIQKVSDILAGDEFLPVRLFEGQSGAFPIRDFRATLEDVLFEWRSSIMSY